MSNINTPYSIQTFTGAFFDPFAPDPDLIRLEDIAHALSRLPRFGGHTRDALTVAQHSLLVSHFCPPEAKLDGLFHDASEAYLVDIPRPIKRHPKFAFYLEVEAKIQETVAAKFGLEWPMPAIVHEVDNLCMVAEAKVAHHGTKAWGSWKSFQGLDTTRIESSLASLLLCSPESVERMFLQIAKALIGANQQNQASDFAQRVESKLIAVPTYDGGLI